MTEKERLIQQIVVTAKQRDEAIQKLRACEEALLRMGDQLCDWQTRAIEAERKLRERR